MAGWRRNGRQAASYGWEGFCGFVSPGGLLPARNDDTSLWPALPGRIWKDLGIGMASSLVIPSTKMFFSPFLSSGYVACQTSEHQSSQRGELDSKGVFPSSSRRQDALSEVQGRMTGSGKQDGVRAPCKAPRSAAALFPLPGGLGWHET